MKKSIIIVVIILLAAGLGAYLYMHNKAQAPSPYSVQNSDNNPNDQPVEVPDVAPDAASTSPTGKLNTIGNTSTPGHFSAGQEGDAGGSPIQVAEIDFDGSKFTPDSINIKVNDYVFFKNTGAGDFWPLSRPLSAYPAFDSLKTVATGKEFKFQFTKAGKWKFNDYYQPKITGTVNVSQ